MYHLLIEPLVEVIKVFIHSDESKLKAGEYSIELLKFVIITTGRKLGNTGG